MKKILIPIFVALVVLIVLALLMLRVRVVSSLGPSKEPGEALMSGADFAAAVDSPADASSTQRGATDNADIAENTPPDLMPEVGSGTQDAQNASTPTALLKIIVTDSNKGPLHDVTLRLDMGGEVLTSTLSHSGDAEITVKALTPGRIEARNLRGIAYCEFVALAPGAKRTLTMTLANHGIIRGRVTDSRKRPLEGIRIQAFAPAQEQMKDLAAFRVMFSDEQQPLYHSSIMSSVGEGITDASGDYVIKPAVAGFMQVRGLPLEEPPLASFQTKHVVLEPDGEVGGTDFVYEESEYLEGLVRDPDGKPIPDANISVRIDQPLPSGIARAGIAQIEQTFSRQDGTFRVHGFQKGQFATGVTIQHPDYEKREYQKINPLDGVLEVTLVPNRKAVLVAVDGDSRAPVPRYRYRLLRETYRGWNPDQLQPRGKEVNHPLGEEPLKGFEGRDIIAQVIELDGAGTPTGRRGATQFHLDQSTQALRVEIPVRPPQMQTGIVLAGDGDQPVENARISVEPMRSWWDHAIIPSEEDFDPPEAGTDSAGRFTLGPLFPGRYTLAAEKDGLKPDPAPLIEIPSAGDPGPIEVRLNAGGVIFGRVAFANGNPADNVRVQLEGHIPGMVLTPRWRMQTRADGTYRFESLQAGLYYVKIPDYPPAGNADKKVHLTTGKEEEVDFDLEEPVVLTGRITLGGKPLSEMGRVDIFLMPAQGGLRTRLYPGEDGKYQTQLLPGKYHATVGQLSIMWYVRAVDEISGGIFDEVNVAPEPPEQTHDFDLQLASATVLIEVPDGDKFRPGVLELSQRVGGVQRDRLLHMILSGLSTPIDLLPPGEYQAHYRSNDGDWIGESPWTPVTAGEENILAVLRQTARKVRLGGWSPPILTGDPQSLAFPVTPLIEKAGRLRVVFDYTAGLHCVTPSSASLRGNGNVISSDAHRAVSGASKIGVVYTLQAPEPSPGVEYVIETVFEAGTGQDSHGDIWLYIEP